MDSVDDHPDGWGFPIRKSPDQSVLATPRSLSQPITSFIASQCQGIRQTPLLCLIPQLFVSETTILRSSLRLVPCRGRTPARRPLYPFPATPSGKMERGNLDFKDLILPINDVKERWQRRTKRRAFCGVMVEADGIEPTTSCLQSRRSPN